MLIDNHGRTIDYLRLAVTDRCNLRCTYCMPEQGIDFMPRKQLLSFEEMERLVRIFAKEGIRKVRITGGEPFVRKGLMEFLERLALIEGIEELSITTNGTLARGYLPRLEVIGITSINLSLDSLDRDRFFEITRRDQFMEVMGFLQELLNSSIQTKINTVVMDGRNIDDILPMLELTRDQDIAVRFIEEMPFNGSEQQGNSSYWSMPRILGFIQDRYDIEKLSDPVSSTSVNHQIKNYRGTFGVIPAFTRTICGSCNRLRLTPQGALRTCLYSKGVVSFRDLMRQGASDVELAEVLHAAVARRAKDGFEAEQRRAEDPVSESMATIGG